MKKMFLAPATLLVVSLIACQPPPAQNKNYTQNAATNQNSNTNASSTPAVAPRAAHEKNVVVSIVDLPGNPTYKCKIQVDSGDPTELKKDRDKVSWEVKNDCEAANNADVIMEGFKSKENPADVTPFGGNACDNKFTIDRIRKGDSGRVISRTAKGATGNYKYMIKVSGAGVAEDLDPVILIGLQEVP